MELIRSTDSWITAGEASGAARLIVGEASGAARSVAAKTMFQNVDEFVETLKEEKCRLKDMGD